jgi:hypothetical protein
VTLTTTAMPGAIRPEEGAASDSPLQALSTCHDQMRGHCTSLARLMLQIAEGGPGEAACRGVSAAMRFFDCEAPRHHADEDTDLRAALLESMAGSDAVCIHEQAAHLAREHRALESAWQGLRPLLEAAMRPGAAWLPAQEVNHFSSRLLACMEWEEAGYLQMAARLLDDRMLAEMAAAMLARRPIA